MSKKQGAHPQKQLSAAAVRNMRTPGRYADGNGLYLLVTPSGAKRWVLRIVVQGKRRDIGLGSVRVVSLAEARVTADEFRRTARSGGDPIAERAQASHTIPTFEHAARSLHQALAPGWKNPKHRAQWINTLEQYAFPAFGTKRVDQVTTDDVKCALLSIWHEKPETARRVRQRIRLVMDAAIESKHRPDNPAHIKAGLPKQNARQEHLRALPYAAVPGFVASLRERDALDSAKLALEFIILTAARTGEVLGARWSEIDTEAETWTVPAERMKAKEQHRVPLSNRALVVLGRARALSDGSGFVFPGKRQGKPLSSMTLLMIMRRMGIPATVHGFRSSFRDWTEECTRFPNNVCESALAHKVRNMTERAYRRTDHFEQRKELMARWAAYVASPTGKVVPLRA